MVLSNGHLECVFFRLGNLLDLFRKQNRASQSDHDFTLVVLKSYKRSKLRNRR